MSTVGVMITRIADELARSDLNNQIRSAIYSAIGFYSNRRWWFSESSTSTFSTVIGQEWYGSSDATFLTNALSIDSMSITVGTDRREMTRLAHAEMEDIFQSTDRGEPAWWEWYGQRLRLYPVANAVRTVTVALVSTNAGWTTLSVPPDDSDSGAWTVELEELVRLRAKADLFENVIRGPDALAEADRMRARGLEVEVAAEWRNAGTASTRQVRAYDV